MNTVWFLFFHSIFTERETFIGCFSTEEKSFEKARELENDPDNMWGEDVKKKKGFWIHQREIVN